MQQAAMIGRRRRRGRAGGLLTVVSDTFTRVDSAASLGTADTGQVWTAQNGTWGISSNQAYFVSGGTANDRNATLDSGKADCTVSVTISAFTGDNPRLVARWSDNSNYLILSGNPALAWDLYKRVAGAFTSLGSGGGGATTGDVISLVLNGSSIIAKVNGATIITVSDAFNSTATKHGLGNNTGSATNRWDNFTVTVP